MHIFLVAGGSPSWRNSGWGQALTHGAQRRTLVSFVEFSKDARPDISAVGMDPTYTPKLAEPQEAESALPLSLFLKD